MASEVIKRDGTREPFDPEKIRKSIATAAERVGLPEERKKEVVEQVATTAIQMAAAKEVIPTSEIRERILSKLDGIEPAVSTAWRKYDAEKKGAGA
ncbi:MAG: ATP cone domain-containing protein [Candidatus Aminicenantales bacterium]